MKLSLFLIFITTLLQGYEVSICAIFRDEAPYLKEWIEFHKIQGVEHFYLYNNNSTDNCLEILQPYIKTECVTLVDWPYTYVQGRTNDWKEIQNSAYMHCLTHYRDESTWVAVIDLDEFLFCTDGTPLGTFLQSYLEYGGVCVNWLMFGTSGVEDIPPGQTMIEHLTYCAPLKERKHVRGKSIVQPKYVVGCRDAHSFTFRNKLFAVNTNKKNVQGGLELREVLHDKIRINHYWTRTESWFREKKIPSRNQRRTYETSNLLNHRANIYNDRTDTAILKFVPLLKQNMGFNP